MIYSNPNQKQQPSPFQFTYKFIAHEMNVTRSVGAQYIDIENNKKEHNYWQKKTTIFRSVRMVSMSVTGFSYQLNETNY